MTLTPGSRLGPYEILSPLGVGGMGEVYRARDTRLERTVAVKVLPSHMSAASEVRQRFEREAKTISQLSHPHICALYDVGNQDGVEYLVMEYLEGETLADRLAKGALTLEQTLRYGMEIADALDKAHRQGIVHRDLKPGNVMLTKSGVKLLDFGLAKAVAPAAPASDLTSVPTMAAGRALTREGMILGTFQYMAPEQLEGKEADARTDIFAFGAVLYEMATGKKAFIGTSQASLIGAILHTEPQAISTVQPMTPPALDRVVKTCLAKDPEERWQSAGDVAKEFKWIAEGALAGTVAPPAVAVKRRTRERLAWVLVGAAVLAALYLANVIRLQRNKRPTQIHSFIVPPENTPFHLSGDEGAPIVISPDGERVVFGAGTKLWVHSLRTGAVAALAFAEGARFPFWSPDSRSIGFFSGGKLKIVEASGGPIQTLCDAPNARGGAWGSAGVIVFAPDIRTGLERVAASGGSPVAVTRVDGKRHTTHRWPYFLPDGKHFLYLAANHSNPTSEDSGIYLASLAGGEPRRLISAYGSAQFIPGWLLTIRDTSLMAQPFDADSLTLSGQPFRVVSDVNFDIGIWRGVFSASNNGLLTYQLAQAGMGGQLTWMDLSGRPLSTVGERSEAYSPELSPDGRRVSVILGDPDNDIWVYEVERGVRTRLTTDAQALISPLWSPDGSEILFVSNPRGDEFDLYTMPAQGGGRRKLLHRSKERLETTSWSRDGRYVLCNVGNIGSAHIWAFPLADPSRAFRLLQSPFPESGGEFSPDGRWLAYISQPTGRSEVYVTPFPGSGPSFQVSGNGGSQPRWSPDGRQLFFVSAYNDLLAATVDGSGSRFEVKDVRSLFRANMFTGPRTILHGFAVAPDGKRLLVNSSGDFGVPRVALIANWTAALPK